MRRTAFPLALLASLLFVSHALAASIVFTVGETAGLRRFGYPVTASLEMPQGAMRDVATTRLFDAKGKEAPAQFTAMAKWPDGSVRGLDVDFTSSLGPMETETYRVEPAGGAARAAGRGLGVTETADEIIVASSAISHKIRRDGKPLLTSIAHGKTEFIAAGGITTTLTPGRAEVLKRGPFNVTLRLGAVTLEYVSSKSWVKITQRATMGKSVEVGRDSVEPSPSDNAFSRKKEARRSLAPPQLAVDAHFALPEPPLLWDFGVESWLYGCFRKSNETVALWQTTDGWRAMTGAGEPSSVYASGKRWEGWGHLADKQRVIAFGMADFGAGGEPAFRLGADGRLRASARRKELTVYFHAVGQPVQVTAATSPPSMLAPLVVEVKK
ncbi:MAG: hypothetical protein NTY01_22380 [Verrucomicrobia bacterium]|nr:hypothetical protein [Verrucomicrobiota bacterium]